MNESQLHLVLQSSTALLLLCFVSCHGQIVQPSHRPNIVLFLADDMGYGDLGCYGNEKASTPNIDSLAREGLRFTRMYSQPTCTPTRGSILTGRYPIRYGMLRDTSMPRVLRSPVFSSNAQPGGLPGSEEPFLSSMLKTNVYRQALIGKWHLGVGLRGKHLPMHYGFDLFYGIPGSHFPSCTTNVKYRQTDLDVFLNFLTRDNLSFVVLVTTIIISAWLFKLLNKLTLIILLLIFSGFLILLRIYFSYTTLNDKSCILMRNYDILEQPYKEDNMTLRLTTQALQFTSTAVSDNRPFFLFMSYLQVHFPPFTSQSFKNKSGLGPYYDSVMELDWSVGAIVKQLKTLGVYNNTIVIFASDNGPELTNPVTRVANPPETCGSAMFVKENGEKIHLRGEKDTVWEAGIRVPAVITWPENIEPEQTTGALADLMDIYPTIRDIVQDQNTHKELDGRSLLPLIRNPRAKSPHEFLMHYCHLNVSAVTYGDYKVHFSSCDGVTFDIPQLYNIVNDPGETNTLPLSQHEGLVDEVISAVKKHQNSLTPFPSQFSQLLRPWLYPCANFPYCQKCLEEDEHFDDLFIV